jgi:hypothetical protein
VIGEERISVLEVIARDRPRQDAFRRNRLAVCRHDERNFARLDYDHGHAGNLVLPHPQPEVPAGRQQPRLIAGLAVQRDDASRCERRTEALDHQPGLVFPDDARAAGRHSGEQHCRDNAGEFQNQQVRKGHDVSSARTKPAVRDREIPAASVGPA